MKRLISILLILALSVVAGGCSAKKASSAEYETVDWNVVSIEPEDYGITDEMLSFIEDPHFSEYTLAELCAYDLHTDGAGAEGAGDELYQRFMQAPNTVLNFLALIGDQIAGGGRTGDETAVTELCREIATADVAWHGNTEEFNEILNRFQETYSTGRISELLTILQEEHDASIDRNT